MKTKEIIRDYREIKEDYKYDGGIFCPDDDIVRRVKYIINHKLSIVDKTLILLYTEDQSYRKLGKRLNLSHMTCRKEIVRIKGIIRKELGI